ncbi:MAG: DnaJ domain-containing protein, partial [Armatimonadetes bacterium]|nr:DnaJ domain-containing protein [Anaerolineae bacterium]
MALPDFNPYEMLGITSSASPEDIKNAYRRLARRLHPDT